MSLLQKAISGTLNNTVLRSARDTQTHGGLSMGKRSVLREFPTELADQAGSSASFLEEQEVYLWQLTIVKAMIRERCQSEEIAMLVERRLFEHETYANLAFASGIPETTLRSWVLRVREYLGLATTDSEENGLQSE